MGKKYKILVAEDEEYNYILVKYILQKEGIEVIRASNGQEAVDLVYNNADIDLVLMDIKMPVLNGLEATSLIKKFNKSLPVVAITAYALAEDRKTCLEAGCNDFISKPITREHLLEITKNILDSNGS